MRMKETLQRYVMAVWYKDGMVPLPPLETPLCPVVYFALATINLHPAGIQVFFMGL
jgi:hypothetical protein